MSYLRLHTEAGWSIDMVITGGPHVSDEVLREWGRHAVESHGEVGREIDWQTMEYSTVVRAELITQNVEEIQ